MRISKYIFWAFLAFGAHAVYADAMPKQLSNNAPIEITSDKLDVFQDESHAVFTGHVVAIQGQVRLKSDKMTVYYKKPENKPGQKSVKKSVSKKGATPDQSAIEKIEVEGSVFMSTPEETASGTSGLYDVENHQIFLNNNVVLTKGKNILKGDHLVYNLETGKSTVTQGTAVQGEKNQRVRALFVPDNNKDKNTGK